MHGWIEVKLKKVFEGYYVHRSLIVGAQGLDAGGYNNVNPRLKHGFQIAHRNSFVYCGKEEAQTPRTLSHDLTPAFPERSLYGENDCVRRIPAEVFDRRKYEIRLSIDDWL